MEKKGVVSLGVIILSIWLFYWYLIMNISRLEKENLYLDKSIKELIREREQKKLELEKLTDLSKIEKEMKEKKHMIISEKVNFFRIKKNFDDETLGE